jgi:hypothetical protein
VGAENVIRPGQDRFCIARRGERSPRSLPHVEGKPAAAGVGAPYSREAHGTGPTRVQSQLIFELTRSGWTHLTTMTFAPLTATRCRPGAIVTRPSGSTTTLHDSQAEADVEGEQVGVSGAERP